MHRKLAESILAFERGIARSKRPEDRKLASDYLSALAPLLAEAVLGNDVLPRIQEVERLLGQTWIIDPAPFEEAFEHYSSFRDEYESFAVGGMTVNERLTALGLAEAVERAAKDGNREVLVAWLRRAHLDDSDIDRIVADLM